MKKRFLALALGTLAFGVTLGGVKMGLGHQDTLMVKAAADAETAFSTLTFSSKTNSVNVQDYKSTWSGTANDGSVFSIKNFNNNNNGWNFIKCGSSKAASVASIVNSKAIEKAVTKVQITIDKITASSVNSIKLYISSNLNFETSATTVFDFDKATGVQSVPLTESAANLFYKIEFDCQKGSSNGLVQLSKVEFFESTSAEPASPVKSISAGLANPDAVFYAGDKVTLDDFVITATHENDTSSVLKTGVTIENPDLVEGANVLNFVYGSGENERRCQFTVNAVKGNFFTKTTNVNDIVVGKKIYIGNSDGTAILGQQNKNNRGQTEVTSRNDKIVAQDSYVSLLVLPGKAGTFALYDEKAGGVLYAAGSGSNYLRTEKDFASIDANSFAKFAFADEAWTIKFTGSNTNNSLRYNSTNSLFSCYESGQIAPSIYVSPDAPVTFGTETWATSFMENLEISCDPTGATALPEADWTDIKSEFDALSIPDKMAIKYGTSNGTEMDKALKAYDFIVKKYVTYNDFLGRRTTTRANALMLPGATDSTTWTLVGIGAVTIAASASLLFFRRKKSN